MFNQLKPAIVLPPVCIIFYALTSFKTIHPGSFFSKPNSAAVIPLTGKLRLKAMELKFYARQHEYNSGFCFLIDMSIPSGKNRFYVYNFENDGVELAGLVTEGMGRNPYNRQLEFSNEEGSLCTSLGKYKIGNSYSGKYGTAYRLHGLDETNNNALKRCVVLHGYDCVPDDEVFPGQICKSEGCPMVSPAFFQELKTYLDQSERPVLLLIYN